jgi:hypothetical protein
MKHIELLKREHKIKVGHVCDNLKPNLTEDAIFLEAGKPVGFYIRELPKRPKQLLSIANKEFRTKKVPKSAMNRTSGETGNTEKVQQYSTIIGSVQPRPHMGRPEPRVSSVHQNQSARTFVKAMILLAGESLKLIRKYTPELYEQHVEAVCKSVPEKWRFAEYFSSSISNYNIAASYHRDAGNVVGSLNVICSKKWMATGGNLSIPDYGITIEQSDNSMIVYPAWRNIHGVTPIVPHREDGYRNSLVFYSLKAFSNHG